MTKAITIFSCANELHKIAIIRWSIEELHKTAIKRWRIAADKFPTLVALEGCSKNQLPNHAVRKKPVVQFCTCNRALAAPLTSAYRLVKHISEARKISSSGGLFCHYGPKSVHVTTSGE